MNLLSNKRIFIVEDNMANRAIETVILERQGAVVSMDRYGTETLERMIRFAPVHLVVMDLMLQEGVSGFDVAAQIRQHPDFKDVPIVAVSAADPAEVMAKVRAKGFKGFISKPVDYDRFPRQLARVLGGGTVWNED